MTQKVRIGIDVGGTFTDAVAIDSATLEIIDQKKVPTTHSSPIGVADGIIQAIRSILSSTKFSPDDVTFIAHGTTQATNALLEGDVVKIGIIGMSSGLDGLRARDQSNVKDVILDQGHVLRTCYQYIPIKTVPSEEQVQQAVKPLLEAGAQAFVASESYSVDDPRNELKVLEYINKMGFPATATHQISKRYGLKMRTRTSVINASILPKMVQSASMTETSVKNGGITAPLMIMRGDGGAMSIDEMRKRPILTLLSGPAAGVAGALMYARVSDGIFLEVGGTSTDISAIRNGQVLVDNAEIGGHSLYLPSLDIRTVGLAGGSMIRLRKGRIAEVGPRSAHIAGLQYAVYADPSDIVSPKLTIIKPMAGDPEEYAAIMTGGQKVYALTLSCAANILGMVPEGAYAAGSAESARRAFQPLADEVGVSVDEAARLVLDKAIEKVVAPVQELMKKYGLTPSNVLLVGGGGGAAAVVPYLSKMTGFPYQIVPKAEVISTIGVALAMVRDMVERTVSNPSNDEILSIRKEAETGVINMGAVPGTVEVVLEIDTQMNIVRAVATGALEMRSHFKKGQGDSPEIRRQIAAISMGTTPGNVRLAASTDNLDVFTWTEKVKQLFGLFSDQRTRLRVMDSESIVRLKLNNAVVVPCGLDRLSAELKHLIDQYSAIKESGQLLPNIFILYGARIVNLTGLASYEQIQALAKEELAGTPKDTELILLADKR
jgi:N-methylhydantoinase A